MAEIGKGEPGLGFWWRTRKDLKFPSFFPGTQSLKASAAVETVTWHYVVSILMTTYGNFHHSALSHYKHEASYIIQIAAFPAKDKTKPQDSWTLSVLWHNPTELHLHETLNQTVEFWP